MKIKYNILISYYTVDEIIKNISNVKDSEDNGECIFWYRNGQMKLHCCYKNDVLNGEFTMYDYDDNIIKKTFYKNGNEEGNT